MMWETEEERLKLLAEVIAEQAGNSPNVKAGRRNFAPLTKPSKPRVRKRPRIKRDTKPLPEPAIEVIRERRHPQPSVLDLAVARWLERKLSEGQQAPRSAERSVTPEVTSMFARKVQKSVVRVSRNRTVKESKLDHEALEWLKAQGFR
jgi:hypothetical protein